MARHRPQTNNAEPHLDWTLTSMVTLLKTLHGKAVSCLLSLYVSSSFWPNIGTPKSLAVATVPLGLWTV